MAVADKFFIDVGDTKKVYDIDVLIKTTNSDDKDSVINDFEKYFSQLWNSEFTVVKKEKKSKYKQDKAKLEKERLLANLNKAREEKSYVFEDNFNLNENFVVVDSEEFTKALTDDMESIMEKSYAYGDEKIVW